MRRTNYGARSGADFDDVKPGRDARLQARRTRRETRRQLRDEPEEFDEPEDSVDHPSLTASERNAGGAL